MGAGLVAVGLLMQLAFGPVTWETLRWPANGIAAAAFLALVAALHLLRKKARVLRFISTYRAAVPALLYTLMLTLVMGLGVNDMLSAWPFVLCYAYLTLILGLLLLRQIPSTLIPHPTSKTPATLTHLGLFLALTSAALGHADRQRLRMIAETGSLEWRAADAQGRVVALPFAIELQAFIMETYADGKPKRFASDIQILTKDERRYRATVDVNKPMRIQDWTIYQYSYDTRLGARSRTSVFELIRDPWLPLVYTGIYLMLAGAVCAVLLATPWAPAWRQARKHPKSACAIALLVGIAFCGVRHAMPILSSDTLVPALQSPWFRPHIIAYMLAYTLMASAAVIALLLTTRRTPSSIIHHPSSIIHLGLALMTMGMLFGALWAKEAWGHYWSWDPKETWAAITWLAYVLYIHYCQLPTHRPRLALTLSLIAFALLQMCWWGIRYLPSAQATIIHVYQ